MRAIQTETQLPLGKIKAILEQEIEELIGGVDLRQLVRDRLFGATKPTFAEPEAEGAAAAVSIAGALPSDRLREAAVAHRDPRAAGRTPPSHSILKGK